MSIWFKKSTKHPSFDFLGTKTVIPYFTRDISVIIQTYFSTNVFLAKHFYMWGNSRMLWNISYKATQWGIKPLSNLSFYDLRSDSILKALFKTRAVCCRNDAVFWLQVRSYSTLLCHWVKGHHFWPRNKTPHLTWSELSKLIFFWFWLRFFVWLLFSEVNQ